MQLSQRHGKSTMTISTGDDRKCKLRTSQRWCTRRDELQSLRKDLTKLVQVDPLTHGSSRCMRQKNLIQVVKPLQMDVKFPNNGLFQMDSLIVAAMNAFHPSINGIDDTTGR
jgi:hypothetical protein